MITSIICFEDRKNNVALKDERAIISLLNDYAVYVDRIIVLDCGDKNKFSKELQEESDAVFIVNAHLAAFDVAAVLSEKSIKPDEEGFFIDNRLISLVPQNAEGYGKICINKLGEFFGLKAGRLVFKVFGKTKSAIEQVTNSVSLKYPSVFFNISTQALDSKVCMFYSDKATKMDVDNAVKEFITSLKNNIYAESDISIAERLKDILKLRRLVISTAESMTGGRIASKIVEVDGASDVFYEGMVTYNTLAKERRLDVKHSTVTEKTVVSSEVAYEMAAGILKNADVAISITGYAGSSVSPSADDGKCFIGIGMKEKTEVYEFHFGGARKENIETAANMALYLAFKTIADSDI